MITFDDLTPVLPPMIAAQSAISKAIEAVGLQPLAKACGVTYQALRKWEVKGRLPRTDWTGETDYASKISAACAEKGVEVTVADLKTIVQHQEAA